MFAWVCWPWRVLVDMFGGKGSFSCQSTREVMETGSTWSFLEECRLCGGHMLVLTTVCVLIKMQKCPPRSRVSGRPPISIDIFVITYVHVDLFFLYIGYRVFKSPNYFLS